MSVNILRCTAVSLVVAAGSLVLLGAPASAQACYPPVAGCVTTTTNAASRKDPTLNLAFTTLKQGETVDATITGFDPSTSGTVSIASVEQRLTSFAMPASGSTTVSITIPNDFELGAHTVFVRGTFIGGPGSASQAVTVIAANASTGGSGGLARTGMRVIPVVLVGCGLVAGGLALKRSTKRRGVTA